MRVAIVGSGLSAISAAKALIARGVKPYIFDVGLTLDAETSKKICGIRDKQVNDITASERKFICRNPTLTDGSPIPKKLVFGSDFFYGKSDQFGATKGDGPLPPFSFAKGGFSTGWGAAALPPDECDLIGWPIKNDVLGEYYRKVFETIPYSAVDDELSHNFPVYHPSPDPIELSHGNSILLADLRKTNLLEKGRLVYGQSRLLTYASGNKACRMCGMCMSGCIYGSIYKSSSDLDAMIGAERVSYHENCFVHTISEDKNGISVGLSNQGREERLLFDKVFLGAGAVNSTRIVLNSKRLFNQKVNLKTRGGFVAPMLRLRGLPLDLPNANTQPGIFLEFKIRNADEAWVHTQFSTPNELVYQKLNIALGRTNLIQLTKKIALKHLVVAFCNSHSNFSDDYELYVNPRDGVNTLHFRRLHNPQTEIATDATFAKLGQIARKIGCLPLRRLVRRNKGTYHVGCSLPMKRNPVQPTDTSLLGVPIGFDNLHVIDSSIFPSLPGTTIGLLAMANAYRIASEAEI